MTVHVANTDTPNKLPVTLLHSFLKISVQNYEVTYQVVPQAKTQSKVLVAVLLLWIKSFAKEFVERVYYTCILYRLKEFFNCL